MSLLQGEVEIQFVLVVVAESLVFNVLLDSYWSIDTVENMIYLLLW